MYFKDIASNVDNVVFLLLFNCPVIYLVRSPGYNIEKSNVYKTVKFESICISYQ